VVRFKCSHCQTAQEVPDHLAGEDYQCPECKGLTQVPKGDAAPHTLNRREKTGAPNRRGRRSRTQRVLIGRIIRIVAWCVCLILLGRLYVSHFWTLRFVEELPTQVTARAAESTLTAIIVCAAAYAVDRIVRLCCSE
jgi:hypothetical protein